jgi:hypothetical protein
MMAAVSNVVIGRQANNSARARLTTVVTMTMRARLTTVVTTTMPKMVA